MLQKIEVLAKANGYTCMLLESGELLTSAMHLYRSNGYLEIENYGPYQNDTEAVCMKKIFKLSRFNFFMRNKKTWRHRHVLLLCVTIFPAQFPASSHQDR